MNSFEPHNVQCPVTYEAKRSVLLPMRWYGQLLGAPYRHVIPSKQLPCTFLAEQAVFVWLFFDTRCHHHLRWVFPIHVSAFYFVHWIFLLSLTNLCRQERLMFWLFDVFALSRQSHGQHWIRTSQLTVLLLVLNEMTIPQCSFSTWSRCLLASSKDCRHQRFPFLAGIV